MQQLLDGDPVSNNGSGQWSAGTDTDAAPYFHIFNPVTQGKKFDPSGDHVRRWVPELARVPGNTSANHGACRLRCSARRDAASARIIRNHVLITQPPGGAPWRRICNGQGMPQTRHQRGTRWVSCRLRR